MWPNPQENIGFVTFTEGILNAKLHFFFSVFFEIQTSKIIGNLETDVCVSGDKRSLFFGKFGVVCFLETPVLRFALLPYYRRIAKQDLNVNHYRSHYHCFCYYYCVCYNCCNSFVLSSMRLLSLIFLSG